MAKKFAVTFGIIFVIVGLLGFVSNPIVGSSEGVLFHADTTHNIIHIIVGVVLLIAAKSQSASAMWLKIWGVVYLILFIDGLIQPEKLLGFVGANTADTWLHLVLGVILLLAGLAGGKSQAPMIDKATM